MATSTAIVNAQSALARRIGYSTGRWSEVDGFAGTDETSAADGPQLVGDQVGDPPVVDEGQAGVEPERVVEAGHSAAAGGALVSVELLHVDRGRLFRERFDEQHVRHRGHIRV